jgi:hypothetical protein
LRVIKIIPRNIRLELNIPLFGKWEPHKYVQEYNFPRKAIYPRFPPFLPHVHPFFHPFYSHEIAWESFIPRKWKPMILNKIPYLPLSFPLNFSLLFPLIFSPMIFYKKKKPMIFVVFINCLLFGFWISLFSSRYHLISF